MTMHLMPSLVTAAARQHGGGGNRQEFRVVPSVQDAPLKRHTAALHCVNQQLTVNCTVAGIYAPVILRIKT